MVAATIASMAIAALSAGADAATVYANQDVFLSIVGTSVTDGYQDAAYEQPDNVKGTFTDARMSEILGETRYVTTGLANRSIVELQSGEGVYCAGCNGSFRLDFTATSVGDQNGVYAVGFHVVANQPTFPYVAFVTYGDNTTGNFNLPVRSFQTPLPPTLFWGISSSKKIRSIHFGGSSGTTITSGGFAIDDLTIGASLLPDTDADGLLDNEDNCIDVPNGPLPPDAGGASQLDSDQDGYGNACDADLNNSGLVTAADVNLMRGCLNQLSTFSALCAAADLNGSGQVTVTDYNLLHTRINQAPGPSGVLP